MAEHPTQLCTHLSIHKLVLLHVLQRRQIQSISIVHHQVLLFSSMTQDGEPAMLCHLQPVRLPHGSPRVPRTRGIGRARSRCFEDGGANSVMGGVLVLWFPSFLGSSSKTLCKRLPAFKKDEVENCLRSWDASVKSHCSIRVRVATTDGCGQFGAGRSERRRHFDMKPSSPAVDGPRWSRIRTP